MKWLKASLNVLLISQYKICSLGWFTKRLSDECLDVSVSAFYEWIQITSWGKQEYDHEVELEQVLIFSFAWRAQKLYLAPPEQGITHRTTGRAYHRQCGWRHKFMPSSIPRKSNHLDESTIVAKNGAGMGSIIEDTCDHLYWAAI